MLICLTSFVHAISFETSNLSDGSASNYIEFTGKRAKISNVFEKIVADFNNDGFDDILSLGGQISCPVCSIAPPQPINSMEMMLYRDGEYYYHEMSISITSEQVNVIDIDQDNDLDIVLLNGQIAINDGLANFSLIRYTQKEVIGRFFTFDWDQDNDLDIISENNIYINDGNQNFSQQKNQITNNKYFIVADLNHDNKPDLLVNNNKQLQSWIYTNNEFQLISTINLNGSVKLMQSIDVNTDNTQDIVINYNPTASDLKPNLKLLINDGVGNLHFSDFNFEHLNDVIYDSMQITKIFNQDADNDGDTDLWINATFTNNSACSSQQNLLLIYENLDKGTLQHARSLHSIGYDVLDERSTSHASTFATLIDLNQDKLLDVVMTGQQPVVWIQNKGYEFKLSNVSGLQFNNHIQALDFNHDGNADILSSGLYDQACKPLPYSMDISSTTTQAHGALWLGDGTGEFSPYLRNDTSLNIFNRTLEYATFVDLEHTGNFDVIFTLPATENRHRQTFFQKPMVTNPPSFIALPEPTKQVTTADINNDGTDEVIMLADTEIADILILTKSNTKPEIFFEMARLNFGYRNGEIKLSDMDSDGNIDIVTNSKNLSNSINIWYNNGDGSFTSSDFFANDVKSLTIFDINKDGKPDIINANDEHHIWLNQGDRIFSRVNYDNIFWFEAVAQSDPTKDQSYTNLIPHKIESFDINNDGLTDLFTYINDSIYVHVNNSYTNISFYKNYSSQVFNNFDKNQLDHSNLAFADFNNDGLMDFVSASNNFIKINTQTTEKLISGLYYNVDRKGHGFSIEELGRDNLYYSVLYTYDDFGKPDWFAMLNRYQAQEDLWKLDRINGNNIIHYKYNYHTKSTHIDDRQTQKGWLNFFNDNGDHNINKSLYNISDTQQIWDIRTIIGINQKPENDLSGIWWAGIDDAGWGISLSFIQRQNKTSQELVATLYFYDEDGHPRWLIGQASDFTAGQEITVDMKQINGYGRLQTETELSEVSAGSISLNLQQASQDFTQAGTLSMDVFYPDDQTDNKNWTRDNIDIALFSKPRN